ncbi:MAG: (2Fe-2S)-binding protein [Verrucomicrobiaceae bacterium]|nr:(2Fe-2S)-binding protein [Verrucomicrobiaceae bacterium]
MEDVVVHDQRANIIKAVDRETNRTNYPEDFPALPVVPAGRYGSQEFYDLEMKHLWPKSWLQVGHVCEFPQSGSYKLFEQLGLSIIISRGPDGEIRAFHNICRHRGSALLLEKQGVVPRRFVCPYHSWSYDPDGSLAGVPEARNFACLDKSSLGLLPVLCGTMRGMIFINLDPNAMPLATFFAPTEQQIGDFPLQDMVVKDVVTIPMDCNWKVSMDNFMEIYHVNTVHTKSIAPFLDSKTFTAELYKNGHARFATRKRASTIFGADKVTPDGPAQLYKDYSVVFPMFPNSFIPIDPVAMAWQTWWPLGPNKSVMILTMLGPKDDSEADKVFWKGMSAQIASIASEDMVLFADIQRNLESGLLPGVLMGYQEQALYWYQEEIDRRIGIERIPEHLRITPVLAGQMVD